MEGMKKMGEAFQYTGYEKLLKDLEQLADEPYRGFQKKLIPGEKTILGVRVPQLRTLAKQIAKSDWRRYLAEAREGSVEETILQGLVIGYAKMDFAESLERVKDFVPKIQSWAECDVCTSAFRFVKKDRAAALKLIQPYLSSEKEFEIRFAVVMLMEYYMDEEYLDFMLESFKNIHHNGYYAKMAVAWAVSVCYVKFREQTGTFLKKQSLEPWTQQKALQKILESYRVSPEDKREIRAMKQNQKI